MDSVRPPVSPKITWWRDVRRHWQIYAAGLLAMFVTNGTEVLAPKTLQWIIDALMLARQEVAAGNLGDVWADPAFGKILDAAGLFTLVALIGMVGRIFWRFTLARMTHVSSNSMKQGIWLAIRGTSLDHVSNYSLGDLMNRAIGDVNSARWIYGFTLVLTCDVVFFTALGSIAMISIHPGIAIACLSTFTIIPFIALKLARQEYEAHDLAQNELTTLSENVSQSVRGVRAQRASNSFYSWVDAMTDSARRYSFLRMKAQRISINSYPLCSIPTVFSYMILFFWGSGLVVDHVITVGEFAALASYVYLLQGPLAEIGDLVAEWQKGFASLNRIGEIRNFPVVSDTMPQSSDLRLTGATTKALRQQAVLDVQTLSLARGGRLIFEGLSFQLRQGEWLGLSGRVGCGKSSLLQGIAGLIPVCEGTITISGRSPTALRKMASAPGGKSQLVYAPEKPFVFAGSIRHNLCLNQKFSDEELWSALDVVCLGDEARRMSSGLDNIVGEGGVSLSGGQRQRLALARIVLRASGLVLLDDPLSAVDVRTEAQIIGNLRSIWSDLTVVLTSNKQASLACCDISAQVTAKGLSFDATEAFAQNVTEEAVHV